MEFIKEDIYAAARIIGCSYDELVNALVGQLHKGISIVPLYQDVPLPAPPEGKLCRLSALGKQQMLRRDLTQTGIIIGPARDAPDSFRVRWSKGKNRWSVAVVYHKDFIEILKH